MTSGTGEVRRATFPVPSIESLVVGALALYGYRSGLKGISDNSAFVHIRTGIEMVRHGAIPRVDSYSFTATGHRWVVQSWFASAIYGASYEYFGGHFLVFINGVLAALLAGVIATLARTRSAVRTMATATVAVVAGSIYWAPRPLMFGLLCLALLILVVERRASPWWLLPIGWVWVNTHGSFPLGMAWLLARTVGDALDGRGRPRWIERYLGFFGVSLVLAGLNPLGPRLLLFPFAVRDKASVFRTVLEWRSPDFQTLQGAFTLLFLSLALLMLLRSRLEWKDVLPVVGFLGLGLLSVRNIAPAAVVLAPALARAMAARSTRTEHRIAEPGLMTELRAEPVAVMSSGASPRRINFAFVGGLLFAALIFTVGAQRGSAFDFRTYPTQAEDYMASHGLLDPAKHKVAAQDIVGCYLILLRGTAGRVFIDDRFDMYPSSVSEDYDRLLHGATGSTTILDHYNVDVVLWDRQLGLPGVLDVAGGWHQVYPEPNAVPGRHADKHWVVLVRDALARRS